MVVITAKINTFKAFRGWIELPGKFYRLYETHNPPSAPMGLSTLPTAVGRDFSCIGLVWLHVCKESPLTKGVDSGLGRIRGLFSYV